MPGFNIMGGGPIDPNVGGSDFLRTHRWRISGLLGVSYFTNNLVYAKTVDLPDKTFETEEIKTMGGTYEFAKQAKYGDLKINFYGTKELLNELESLADEVHTQEDGVKDFNEYMKNISLDLDVGDGNPIQYTFNNSFITKISYDQLTYVTSDVFSITATFAVGFYTLSGSS
jgi:hypothetical protein